ncbi:zinc ribbon domain-containing protein [bacterium]|nr:zinc ribbon domain-containing protein [bacterium]MBU1983943.1 zinc ribbon domain-containing protein [bacterium]
MPIYEYRCQSCGRTIEVFGQTAEQAAAPRECTCGPGGSFTRLYSAFATTSAGSSSTPDECCGGNESCGSFGGGGCCGGGYCSHGH